MKHVLLILFVICQCEVENSILLEETIVAIWHNLPLWNRNTTFQLLSHILRLTSFASLMLLLVTHPLFFSQVRDFLTEYFPFSHSQIKYFTFETDNGNVIVPKALNNTFMVCNSFFYCHFWVFLQILRLSYISSFKQLTNQSHLLHFTQEQDPRYYKQVLSSVQILHFFSMTCLTSICPEWIYTESCVLF